MAGELETGEERDEHPVDAVRARLAVLQGSAADAYALITAADVMLGTLAERRVAAEQVLRYSTARHQAASRVAAAHSRARPGLLAQLATRFRAGREWRGRRVELEGALGDAERPLATAQQALSLAKDEFAAQVSARAEAVTALRRLTAECAAALEEIAAHREQPAAEPEAPSVQYPPPAAAREPGQANARPGDPGGRLQGSRPV